MIFYVLVHIVTQCCYLETVFKKKRRYNFYNIHNSKHVRINLIEERSNYSII